MGDYVRAALPIAMVIGGMTLIIYGAYLHYVALPEEHTSRHVITRVALMVVGVVLVILGTGLLR